MGGRGVTGRGANCFPGEMPVLDRTGLHPDSRPTPDGIAPRVVSLDESTGEKGLRAIPHPESRRHMNLLKSPPDREEEFNAPLITVSIHVSPVTRRRIFRFRRRFPHLRSAPAVASQSGGGKRNSVGFVTENYADSDVNLRSMRAGIRETGIRTREGVTPRSE